MTTAPSLAADQARALAAATNLRTRLALFHEISTSGTGDSLVHDQRCHLEMSLRDWAAHVRQQPDHHVGDVQLVREVVNDPDPRPPDPPPLTGERLQAKRIRRRVRRQLLDDPDFIARSVGRYGDRPEED